jgi:dihydrodipicolinate synthase/N-acetylneuraminate lyase
MDPKVASFRVVGLCAAPFTPFTASGDLDAAAIAAHVDELVAQGVKYAFGESTCGDTAT